VKICCQNQSLKVYKNRKVESYTLGPLYFRHPKLSNLQQPYEQRTIPCTFDIEE